MDNVYIMIVVLARGFTPEAVEVPDCHDPMIKWMHDARAWALRNDISPLEPTASCGPYDVQMIYQAKAIVAAQLVARR
jgi:hypothetical protein